jgi:hypothetical protein
MQQCPAGLVEHIRASCIARHHLLMPAYLTGHQCPQLESRLSPPFTPHRTSFLHNERPPTENNAKALEASLVRGRPLGID